MSKDEQAPCSDREQSQHPRSDTAYTSSVDRNLFVHQDEGGVPGFGQEQVPGLETFNDDASSVDSGISTDQEDDMSSNSEDWPSVEQDHRLPQMVFFQRNGETKENLLYGENLHPLVHLLHEVLDVSAQVRDPCLLDSGRDQ